MLALMFSTLALAAYDDPEPAAPTGPPPTVLVGSVKGEEFLSRVVQTVAVPVTVTEKRQVGDQVVDVTITKYVTQTRMIEVKRDLKKATFGTAGGKKLSLEDVQKRLDKAKVVVMSSDGRAVDAAYLRVFDKEAIVIVAPVVTTGVAPPPPPPPPPPPKKD